MVHINKDRRRDWRSMRLVFLLALVAGLAWGISTSSRTAQSAPVIPQSVALFGDLPLDVYRRAAQHLEEMRGTDMAPGWERAILGEPVRLLYRPDDRQTPAYYEFPVVIPDKTVSPAGFIILAANENDFPIPHWDFTGDPPTRILDRDSNGLAMIYFKLDTLSYVAEDGKGNVVARLGQIPPKITGMQMEWLDKEQELTESAWIPDETIGDDKDAETISGTLVITGPTAPPMELQLSGWESWDELKDGYAQSYAVFLEQQKREASEPWEAEKANLEYGIVLRENDVYDIAMLFVTPTVALEGPGLSYITPQTVTQGIPLPELFRVTVAGSVPYGITPFTATISYGNDVKETVKFQIVKLYMVYLPLILSQHDGSASTVSMAEFEVAGRVSPNAVSGWSAWTTYWAGTHNDQRLYDQIPAGQLPNTSGCWSGCGGTAWSMLFGWADNQAASGNAYWAPRWGIYRQNGGYGADAVAPRYWDDGVKTMMWDIRQRIATFCAFGSGATAPWDMGRASGYLAGRTGTTLSTHYNVLGIHEGGLMVKARDSIVYRQTPAIIGTGWLNHYPLAYGYRWRERQQCFIWCWTDYDHQFYVNQGWGGGGNGWVSSGTWFAGEIRP